MVQTSTPAPSHCKAINSIIEKGVINLKKQWITVHRHNGHEIQLLQHAEAHEIGYRVPGIDGTFNTIQEAVTAIDLQD